MAIPQSLPIISKSTVFPSQTSNSPRLKLSVSDLPMLSCHYIQKGGIFPSPPFPIPELLSRLEIALLQALTHFPPLAGRFVTDSDGYVYIACNDAGADFIHADGSQFCVSDLIGDGNDDVPDAVRSCFAFDGIVCYDGHFRPLLAVQVTELADGVFIGCSMNHAVADGTSFWNFFNSFAELSRGESSISKAPDFSRESILISPAVLKFPAGGPRVTFDVDAPIRERIFSFSRESILRLKSKVNEQKIEPLDDEDRRIAAELMGKFSNDFRRNPNGKVITPLNDPMVEISSFQSLSALLWRGITRARKHPPSKTTTFRMAINCRHRLDPKLDGLYFGNAIQSIPTYASASDVLGKGIRWCAEQLNQSVVAHDHNAVKKYIENWEHDPRCFPLGNFDGAMVTIGSSPRFPMYDNDFGWGRSVAVRSGKANKFDGKISAFPGKNGGGTVDLEVILAPETMAGLESDPEFMQFVTGYC